MSRLVIIFTWILVNLFVALADKSLILPNKSTASWKLFGHFAKIIEISLNVSRCANVYLSENTVEIQNLFAEFVQDYPYEYTLNEETYWCNGHLAFCSSGESAATKIKSVPTEISTTELLIVVVDRVDETMKLFDVSLYGNANVNIATINGLWCLSENYLQPRIFRNVLRHEDMIHKRGIVDLQGRKLQAAAFYNPPFSYLNTTFNKTFNGVEAEFFFAADDSELDGIETKLFLLMAEHLNFTWAIRKPNNNYRYGRRNESDWYGGMIGQMFRKEIDISFTGIWLELDHYLFTNLTIPWTCLSINFLVPRPKPFSSFWALTRPLSPEVWSTVIAMIVVQSIYVYARARINPRVPTRFRSFVTTWTELVARLVGTTMTNNIQSFKLQFHLWHLIGVLLVTAYSSSLAASLASSGFEPRIDTTQQFIAANLSWGREGPVPKFNDYFGSLDPWAMQFPLRFKHEKNESERHGKILRGNYAIVGRIIGSVFFPENTIRDEDMKGYRLMRHSVGHFYSTFAVQPWLLHSVDKLMLRLGESGLIEYHLRDVIHRRTTSSTHEVVIEHDGIAEGAKVLTVTPLGAGFSMLALGFVISTIVFFYELKTASKDQSIVQVLWRIKKKRELRESRKNEEQKRSNVGKKKHRLFQMKMSKRFP